MESHGTSTGHVPRVTVLALKRTRRLQVVDMVVLPGTDALKSTELGGKYTTVSSMLPAPGPSDHCGCRFGSFHFKYWSVQSVFSLSTQLGLSLRVIPTGTPILVSLKPEVQIGAPVPVDCM